MVGTFKAVIIKHILAENKNGTPSVKFTLDLQHDLLKDVPVRGTVYFDAYLSEAAFPKSMDTLTSCLGWTSSDFAELNDTGKYNGTEVSVVCEENGKYTNVKYMNPIDRAPKAKSAMDAGKARSLAETLKARAMAYRQSNPVKDKPKAAAPQGNNSDSLPF